MMESPLGLEMRQYERRLVLFPPLLSTFFVFLKNGKIKGDLGNQSQFKVYNRQGCTLVGD
jgi:hypothetical protein